MHISRMKKESYESYEITLFSHIQSTEKVFEWALATPTDNQQVPRKPVNIFITKLR